MDVDIFLLRMFKLIANVLKPVKISRYPSRCISVGSDSAAYRGDGRTTVDILNNNTDLKLNLVNTYSDEGFRLANNLFVYGSILLFPTHVFSWNIRRGHEINLDSLLLFDLIVPKVKIVIIGYGDAGEEYDATLPIKLRKKGISCEMLATPHAVTTYNYLIHDSVHVAGAFLPVKQPVKSTPKDDMELGLDLENYNRKEYLPASEASRAYPREEKMLSDKTVGRESKKEKFDD